MSYLPSAQISALIIRRSKYLPLFAVIKTQEFEIHFTGRNEVVVLFFLLLNIFQNGFLALATVSFGCFKIILLIHFHWVSKNIQYVFFVCGLPVYCDTRNSYAFAIAFPTGKWKRKSLGKGCCCFCRCSCYELVKLNPVTGQWYQYY